MRFLAPAKLNLFLHITGRRADGYHALETVFQLVDLCDELDIDTRDDGRICRDPAPSDALLATLSDEEDLTVRAARLLQQSSGARCGANIHVNKRIPAGGGLGGGSSDAATVLLALNELWQIHWSRDRLAELALQLGADVPVFVQGRNAFARGRGELLTPLELPPRWFVIADPGVSVATREIFAAPELTRNTPPLRIAALPPDGGHNDCEPVVRVRYPQVAKVLDLLAPHGGRLTGTGGCVFAGLESRQQAEQLAQQLSAQVRVFVAHGLPHSPH
jgi:4-diphosphocytidyl-2-C-methyl-D-erythritol kinase